jgi:hypothetical protein
MRKSIRVLSKKSDSFLLQSYRAQRAQRAHRASPVAPKECGRATHGTHCAAQ